MSSVEWRPRCAIALAALFKTLTGKFSEVSIADSTSICVCKNLRLQELADSSPPGVSRDGGARQEFDRLVFGFKLHWVIHHLGELLGIKLTPGNVDDRKPLCDFTERLFGKRYADKGDIAQWLTPFLTDLGIDFVTKVRKNRKPFALDPFDQAMLRQ
ncbi:Mobile element protein [Candidatus Accumulibacter phosphatis]|uniref:Mobile element protein n=1 Tax=Candidatus Accumulibacter phosphatis TaxID=327160 RepID=A0A5S4EGW0_9PROT|nr:Mobile element protein [Candidatus Accumulibacter phosphatis]